MHPKQISAAIAAVAIEQDVLIEQLHQRGLISKEEMQKRLYEEAEKIEKQRPAEGLVAMLLTQLGARLSEPKSEQKKAFPDWFQGVVQGGKEPEDHQ